MNHDPTRVLAAALVLAASGSGRALPAQTPGAVRSAPITDVAYQVRFDSAAAQQRQLAVTMTFRASSEEPVLLSLPAWTPGAYELSFFARYVKNFVATAGDHPLAWDKVDYDTWRIRPQGPGPITVSFDYQADTLDNAMSWSRPDFVLFNGTNLFLYPEGQSLQFPARLEIRTEPGWRIATGLARGAAPGTFVASSYHDLVDMPVFVGRFEFDSLQVAGVWYRLATYPAGVLTGSGRASFWKQLRQFVPPLAAVIGETPWDSYTVMMIFDAHYPGASALEHQNSHVGIYNPGILAAGPLLASISAHEMFHAWNVKRLRPADLWPYDYSRPQPTPLLWVSEGVTDYYADLALVRGGVIQPEEFYRLTQQKIQQVAQAPPTALEDASLTTWIHPKDGSEYLYYPKGSLAGLLLDILIRDASDNRASLDVVFRNLYRDYYRAGKGFTSDDFWREVSRAAAGRSFDEFYRRYVDGRDPLPYATVFPLAGLSFRADTSRVPRLGTQTTDDSAGVRVVSVTPGSAASAAGLRPGDVLVKVGDLEVRDASFGEAFRARYASQPEGSPLPLVIRRDGRTLTLAGELKFDRTVSYWLGPAPDAPPRARRIRDGILTGTLAGSPERAGQRERRPTPSPPPAG